MKKYRDVTKADIGKQCEFFDDDSKGKWLAELTKIYHSFYDADDMRWDNCRIEVEDAVEEVFKEESSEPVNYLPCPSNLTESEALEALKKASEEKLEEGWYLCANEINTERVYYHTRGFLREYKESDTKCDKRWKIIAKMEVAK